MFSTPYKRPTKLSDSHHDISPNTLKKLLSKSDAELNWSDYSILFGPHLPGGTYDEVMYFLPRAFRYLKEHNNDAFELVTPIFGFCSNYVDNFKRDGLLNSVINEINDCLDLWTRGFQIIHFDKNACLNKGWCLTHEEIVENSELSSNAWQFLLARSQ